MASRRKSLAQCYSVLALDSSATMKQTKRFVENKSNKNDVFNSSAFLHLAQKHHPDKGGDEASFQLIQSAYAKIAAEMQQSAEEQEGATRPVLSSVGPSVNDTCVIGNDKHFQNRRKDIYDLIKSMGRSCPGRWEMAGHGFIQFVKSERDWQQIFKNDL